MWSFPPWSLVTTCCTTRRLEATSFTNWGGEVVVKSSSTRATLAHWAQVWLITSGHECSLGLYSHFRTSKWRRWRTSRSRFRNGNVLSVGFDIWLTSRPCEKGFYHVSHWPLTRTSPESQWVGDLRSIFWRRKRGFNIAIRTRVYWLQTYRPYLWIHFFPRNRATIAVSRRLLRFSLAWSLLTTVLAPVLGPQLELATVTWSWETNKLTYYYYIIQYVPNW